MRKNIVVLTHGWTGSSLFASLFARAGYWLGDATVRKVDYDTFENAELVALNNRLLQGPGAGFDHEHRWSDDDVARIERNAGTLDPRPFADFLAECGRHGPWLWKDPRLTWTIRTWAPLMDLAQTQFLVLTRDDLQAWITSNQRRHIQSMRFTREYNHGITRSNLRFLADRRLPYLALSFEDLIVHPEPTLARMNGFFGIDLSMADLRDACRLPIGRKSRGWADLVVAALIYAKNYSERDGRAREHRSGTPTPA